MTNFRTDNEQVIGVVDIFEIDSSNENQIRWIDSVVNSLFTGNYF
jgi:aspartyl/asparaginyl beta-hydroxylase (cupin superfamily)